MHTVFGGLIYIIKDNIFDPSFTFVDREITCTGDVGTKAERLIRLYLLNDITINYRDIAVFYVVGNTLRTQLIQDAVILV